MEEEIRNASLEYTDRAVEEKQDEGFTAVDIRQAWQNGARWVLDLRLREKLSKDDWTALKILCKARVDEFFSAEDREVSGYNRGCIDTILDIISPLE